MKLKTILFALASFAPLQVCMAQDNSTVAPVTTTASDGNVTPAAPATCATSDECPAGYFCSSLGGCQMLNCTSWAFGVPAGEVPYSEVPCNAEALQEGSQAYDEGDRFCGWDGTCYFYTCDNWFKFGPVAFTGYDPANPVELTCEEYATGKDDNMNSVVNGCRPYIPGNKAPEAKTWTYFFNQKCSATPRGGDDFQCFQNQENTNYNDFVAEAARINLGSCDREIFENEQPLFWYEKVFSQERNGEVILYKNEREDTKFTPSFDASEADKTMFAKLVSSNEAPAPSLPDSTTFEPGDTPSGAALVHSRWAIAVVAGLGLLAFP